MTAPVRAPAPKPRRVLISWERGSGGPVVSAAGELAVSAGSGTYPRNGYLDLRAEWPERRRISILNRRVVDILDLGPDEDPSTVSVGPVSGGDFRWP